MNCDEQDALEAAQAQQQLEERRQWDAHHQSLRDFRQWKSDMDSEWDRIERELSTKTRRDKTCQK